MLADLLKAAPLLFFAQGLIITAVFFIGGRLLPQTLEPVYTAVGTVGRTVLASIFLFPVGNLICGWCMGKFNPAVVSPTIIASVVLVQVLFTVLISAHKPSPMLIPATLVVMAGSVWVSVLLQK